MAITDIHEDIIKTHILTKLDGPTLASTTCTSSRFKSLSSDPKLWSNICQSTWPSTADPLITKSIFNFSSGHRSFFSDATSSPTSHITTVTLEPQTPQIISSVDIKYHNKLIFSKVELTNTTPSDWFQTSPFRVDLVEPKELVSGVKVNLSKSDRVWLPELENNMTLSWIVIDPTRNRAVNLSSIKPVSVQRNWLTNDIELTFAHVLNSGNDHVNCNIQVTCGVNEGCGELTVSGVSLTVVDVYGKCLSGKDSMVILQGLMTGPRGVWGGEDERKKKYDEYIEKRREKNEKTERRERRLDMAFVASGVGIFLALWSFAIC